MSDTVLRLRATLDRYQVVAVIVLFVLLALGAFVIYGTHFDPDQEPREQVIATSELQWGFDHSATVVEENSVFPVGSELDQRDTYFARIAPDLDGTFAFSYSAEEAEDVSVEMEVTRVIEATEEDTVYWSETEPLNEVRATSVAPGESVESSFTINTTEVEERIDEVEDDLGGIPGETESYVAVDLRVDGVIDGQAVEFETTERLQVQTEGAVYRVDDGGAAGTSIEHTETVLVEQPPGLLARVGGPLLVLLSLLGLFGIAAARFRGVIPVSQTERAYLRYRDDRKEFDDWITRIHLPDETFDRPTARAETLRDLVDFAIDSDTGVVEDPETGWYYAVGSEYLCVYDPPARGGAAGDGRRHRRKEASGHSRRSRTGRGGTPTRTTPMGVESTDVSGPESEEQNQ